MLHFHALFTLLLTALAMLFTACNAGFDGGSAFQGVKSSTAADNPGQNTGVGSTDANGSVATGNAGQANGGADSGTNAPGGANNPNLTPDQQKLCSEKVAVALVIDVSGSMSNPPSNTADMKSTSKVLPGSKMQLTITAAEAFIASFTKNQTDEIGLVEFSTTAKILSPLTSDMTSLKTLVDQMAPQELTSVYGGLVQADQILQPIINDASFPKFIVLMSDGMNNLPGDPVAEATKIKAEGVTIYTVGFTQSAGIQELQGIASDAAHFIDAADGPALNTAFTTIATQLCR